MLRPRYLVELFRRIDESTWEADPESLSNLTEIDTSNGVDVNKDVFNLKFTVPSGRSGSGFINQIGLKNKDDNYLNTGDEVRIFAFYAGSQPADMNDALLFFGNVNELQHSMDDSKVDALLNGVNRTGDMLDTFVPATTYESGSNNTPPKLIKNIIDRSNRFADPKLYAYLSDETNPYTGGSGLIRATKSDDTAFGSISFHESWKSAYEQIDKLSEVTYTSDEDAGKYIFYVVNSKVLPEYYDEIGSTVNEIVWKNKSKITSGSIIEGEDMIAVNISRSVFDVVNGLVVNAGTDLQGHGILTVVYNIDSMAETGPKFSYYLSKHNYSFLRINEFNTGSEAGSIFNSEGYPESIVAGSTWEFLFQERDDTGTKLGFLASATDTDEYNTQLREEAAWAATEEAQKVVDNLGLPRYKVNAELVLGSNNLVVGDLYEVQSKSYGWLGTTTNPTYKLRLVDIRHNLGENGWSTRIQLEEDEEVISGELNT